MGEPVVCMGSGNYHGSHSSYQDSKIQTNTVCTDTPIHPFDNYKAKYQSLIYFVASPGVRDLHKSSIMILIFRSYLGKIYGDLNSSGDMVVHHGGTQLHALVSRGPNGKITADNSIETPVRKFWVAC
jgi:hypothetical protein